MNKPNTVTTSMNYKVSTKESWQNELSMWHKKGETKAEDLRKNGKCFDAAIIGPDVVPSAEVTQVPSEVQLAAAILPLDHNLAIRHEMISIARKFISHALMVNEFNNKEKILPFVFKDIIDGKNLYEDSIGEFFELYGKFEEKYNTHNKATLEKMHDLIDGTEEHLKPYTDRGRVQPVPPMVFP